MEDVAECVKGVESVDTRWRQIDTLHKSGRAAVFELYEASNGYVINNHRERKGYVVENGTHLGGVLECICSDMKGTVATMHKFEKEK